MGNAKQRVTFNRVMYLCDFCGEVVEEGYRGDSSLESILRSMDLIH